MVLAAKAKAEHPSALRREVAAGKNGSSRMAKEHVGHSQVNLLEPLFSDAVDLRTLQACLRMQMCSSLDGTNPEQRTQMTGKPSAAGGQKPLSRTKQKHHGKRAVIAG